MEIEHNIFSGLGNMENARTAGVDAEASSKSCSGEKVLVQEGPEDEMDPNVIASLNGINIIPVLGNLQTLSKQKYQDRLDYVFLSQHTAHWLGNQEFKSALGDQAIIEVETGKFVYQLKEMDQEKLVEKIMSIAEENGFVKDEVDGKENDLMHNTIRFKKQV